MGRERIAMSREEVAALLGAAGWVVVASLDADGYPVGDVAPCAVDGDQLFFAVREDGETARRIASDPRVCCAIDAYPSYYEIRGASVHGEATAASPRPGLSAPGTRTYRLPLDDIVSFDFAKIQNKF